MQERTRAENRHAPCAHGPDFPYVRIRTQLHHVLPKDAEALMTRQPSKNLRWDRILIVLLVMGGAGFAAYWFGLK